MRVGIVGKGYFGKKIHNKLAPLYDIIFFTGKAFEVSTDVDWVVVASSTDSHYEVCKYFLNHSINVFVEKPLTLSIQQSKELVTLAKEKGVKLYVDDVFLYHETYRVLKEAEQDPLSFSWSKYGTFKDNIYNNLTYHDIYMALDLGYNLSEEVEIYTNRVNEKRFSIGKINFRYNRLSKQRAKTVRVGNLLYSFNTNKDPLLEMLEAVFANQVDFDYNNKLALKAQNILDKLNKHKPNIAVVGGGIFGCTSALILQEHFNVTLFERHSDILQEASGINQYRLHRGYHYPRSIDTAISSKKGTTSFVNFYNCEVSNPEQYYAVANGASKVTPKQYEAFMDSVELAYTPIELELLNSLEIDSVYKVQESLYNYPKLITNVKQKLNQSSVQVVLNYQVDQKVLENFDYVVNATYANTNTLAVTKKTYQFELCEKPLVKLPKQYKGIGIVIVDGPFTCIDPYGETDYHVVGNVIHAIHSTNVGTHPHIPSEYYSLLNSGIVSNPSITNFDKFKKDLKKYFTGLDHIEHIGSMFTIRTVLADRDHDDARPSIVEKEDTNTYRLFSGKVSTAVDTANELLKLISSS